MRLHFESLELIGTFERDWTSQVEACDVSEVFWQVWPEICRDLYVSTPFKLQLLYFQLQTICLLQYHSHLILPSKAYSLSQVTVEKAKGTHCATVGGSQLLFDNAGV